jgi:hypothetical protein
MYRQWHLCCTITLPLARKSALPFHRFGQRFPVFKINGFVLQPSFFLPLINRCELLLASLEIPPVFLQANV